MGKNPDKVFIFIDNEKVISLWTRSPISQRNIQRDSKISRNCQIGWDWKFNRLKDNNFCNWNRDWLLEKSAWRWFFMSMEHSLHAIFTCFYETKIISPPDCATLVVENAILTTEIPPKTRMYFRSDFTQSRCPACDKRSWVYGKKF